MRGIIGVFHVVLCLVKFTGVFLLLFFVFFHVVLFLPIY